MSNIHSTAIVAPGAELGTDCEIGPYCVVGDRVRLGDRCRLHAHAVITGHSELGDDCRVFQFACIGEEPQDLKFDGGVTRVRVGARTVLREYVTINGGTVDERLTTVGSDCLIQSYCHVAHDCRVGDGVVMSSAAMLSGHVTVGDGAIIGGKTGVVQFVNIGTLAYIGGYTKLAADVLPFCIADGVPGAMRAVNKIGMDRRGRSADSIRTAQALFRLFVRSGEPLAAAVEQVRTKYGETEEAKLMLAMIERTKHGLARAKGRRG